MGPAEYVKVIRRRWWVISALILIGGGVAWITTPAKAPASETTRFRATTMLVKGPSATGAVANTNLAFAAALAESSVVLDAAATELGRPTAELATGLFVIVDDKAGTLQISSVDADRVLAANKADTVATQLITFLGERQQQQLDPLIASTSDRISKFESRLSELDAQIPPPGTQADLQRAERDSVVRQLSANYDRLQQLTAEVAAAGNGLVTLSPASTAPEATSAGFSAPGSRSARAAIGLAVGLLAGLALVLAFERIDPKIRTSAQAEQTFGLPVIAEIPRQSRWRSPRHGGVATFREPHSVAAESYRGLRTALTYRANEADSAVDRFATGHVVLVTSPSPREGKTTVAANLAAGFAETEGEVVVVSGDARDPAIEVMLLGRRAAGAKLARSEHPDAVATMIPGVKLVLSCDPNGNPASIVAYEREIVRRARARSQIVIIDTPSALVANDATELMNTADSVVLVARCGSTSVASARRTAELIGRLPVPVVGIVLLGTDPGLGAGAYCRKLPRRRARPAPWRWEGTPTELPAAASRDVVTAATRVTASADPITAPREMVDDGGIWRPKNLIDLSGSEPDSPTRLPPFFPARAPRTPRVAQAAHNRKREDLPLFRAGDGAESRPPR